MIIDEFLLQPYIYDTAGRGGTLLSLLEKHWIEGVELGKGTIYIVSGFGNYNGGVRFYDLFKKHTEKGGKVSAIFGGSIAQRLTSKEVVKELLSCGVEVTVLNRKKIMHAKCYGYALEGSQSLVITSGNFTGPGMTQNVEAALGLTSETLEKLGFDWNALHKSFIEQPWDIYHPQLPVVSNPEWQLLYTETYGKTVKIEEEESSTMLVVLGHADTSRINAEPGTKESLGSQYFWLSKDAFDFFPALTIPNNRGTKPTYSTLIEVRYIDLGISENDVRVTFESGNNVDFRLGTGALRNTKIAQQGDVAAISRRSNAVYDLRIIKQNTNEFFSLSKYLLYDIGHKGKKYGYISNSIFDALIK